MKDIFNAFQRITGLASQFDNARRQQEADDYARMARQRAAQVEQHQLDLAASGQLGDARLGTIDDAKKAGLFDDRGLFLGALRNRLIYSNGDGHSLIYARAGGGKGITFVQPNLAHYPGSMFVLDVKDGELHYSSAEHRAECLGHDVIVLDPWGIRGGTSSSVNPLARLDAIVASGRMIDDEADEMALILLPNGKAEAGDNGWVRKGARRLLVCWMKHLAYSAPGSVSLSALWRFINSSDADLEASFRAMISSDQEDVSRPAEALQSNFLNVPKQFEAYRADAIDALSAFNPDSSLGQATQQDEVDFGAMKSRPMTVYLTVPSQKIGVAASWLALVLNHALESVAAASGPNPVRFLLDEFAQLPAPLPAVMKALRLYRGRGILLTMICQGPFSLVDAGYSVNTVKEIEDQSSASLFWGVEDQSLLKAIEYASGNTSIVQLNPSHSGGQVASASLGRSEHRRPVLQVEDIRRINNGKMILKIPGQPLFVAQRVPYFGVTPWKSQLRDVRRLHFGEGF